ncbi:MAG TPA: M23 family metallopeptidase [Actinomycetota bacterium]
MAGWRPWAVTSPFGPRGEDDFHHGMDIGCAAGTPVRAALPGTAWFAGDGGAYGNTVVLDHGTSWQTLYSHFEAITVEHGEFLARGAILGRCGATGRATGPHVHFEVRHSGYVWDPADYLP